MTERASGRASNPPPTGTVTFLFTDIEGSTSMWERYPAQMEAALKRHDEILRSSIEANGGHVFSTGGDAFCVAFTTPREAVRAALAAQRALLAERWPENVTVRVRMGLHTGVAEESEGDYFGPPVNRVARLMSTGHGGQVLLSAVTYGLVRDALSHLEPGAELKDLGEHRLKDLRHTERIFQIVVPDLPKEFAPLKTHGLVTPTEVIDLDRRYRRIRYVGGGGFGNVYLVHHEVLDRDMALKVLGRQYAEEEEFVERFKREAKSAASLNHPNIVQVYDAGEGNFEGQKVSYIAMEYVAGGTLQDLIAQQGGPLPARTATAIALQVAKALEAAHHNGVIHRDIKPQNILITESGEAKVTDFGIARATAFSKKLSQTGTLLGTWHYMAPELWHNKPASAPSDLYALGVVLYQMLTGELPFDAETPPAIMTKHLTEPLRPPKETNPDVPERLNAIVERLLAKEPEERYRDAAALMEDLVERVPPAMEYAEMVADTIPPGATLPPSGIQVPNLAGKDASQASDTLTQAGLALGDREEVPNETIPEGGVIRQSPEAGTEVEVNSLVSVTVSTGPSTVEVPYLAGLDRSEASSTLIEVGLTLGGQNEAPDDDAPEGEIVGQEPEAGTKAKRGSSVIITISSGPQKVAVPDLAGRTLSQAREALAEVGLKLRTRSKASSETVAEGAIIEQNPAAGARLRRGNAVRVTVSTGPTVEVPDLAGLDRSQASSTLAVAGLKLGTQNEATSETIPKGGIIGQSPEAGTKAEADSSVSVTISMGSSTVEVPYLTCLNRSEASSTLAAAGLKLGNQNEVPRATVPKGEIIGQDPPAGTEVKADSSVSITISSGPSTVEVPDLAGLNRSRASSTLAAAGLKLSSQYEAPSDTASEGEIIGQYPLAQTEVERGSVVSVTVSSGPATVEVPDLTGQRLARARIKLANASLKLGSENETPSDTAPKGEIVKQEPAAGTKAKQGSSVRVTVSSGSSRQRDTEAAEDWYNKGNALLGQERYEEALEAYDQATRLDPDDPYTWNNKGVALRNLGRYQEALKAHDQAKRLNPNDPYVWFGKGWALHNLKRYEEALKAYDQATRLDPDHYYAWRNKGVALGRRGRYEEALEALDQATRINPDNPTAWKNKGWVLLTAKRYQEALEAYDRAVRIDPEDSQAWRNKGLALQKLGRHAEAKKAFDRAGGDG